MSATQRRAARRSGSRIERLQPWIAGSLCVLLHLLLLWLVLSRPPVTPTTPQGGDAGSRTEVTFIDDDTGSPPPTDVPPARSTAPRTPRPPRPDAPAPAPAASRLQTTTVERADEPVAPDVADPADTVVAIPPPPAPQPVEPEPEPPSSPPEVTAQAPVPSPPPPSTPRPARTWGQPPGMQAEPRAPVNAGMANSSAVVRGRGRDGTTSELSMDIGGYQVYYEVRSEDRLRAWRDEGITELYLPLPGIREYMICPLEVALRRGSGKCRLLDPYSPEMEKIGDAREVINMQEVYRRGQPMWRGPGPYR
jgi:hypothetical protein